MPMPLPSLQNIMPSPFMPLNIPLPRVEQNRRPHGTYQLDNQPLRVQQETNRLLGIITDNMIRGTTSQKLPITNAPENIPPPTLVVPQRPGVGPSPGRKLFAGLSPTPRQTLKNKGSPKKPRMDDEFPNTLDLKGQNALAVSNQGQNLRVNPGVNVARNEYMEMEEADTNSRGGFDIGRGMNMVKYRKALRDARRSAASSPVFTPTPQPERPNLGRVGTPSPPVDRPTLSKVASSGLTSRLAAAAASAASEDPFSLQQRVYSGGAGARMTTDPFSKLDEFGSGGAGSRMASDTTPDMSN